MLDEERVAEIWVSTTCKRGTGYLLFNGCLLSAHHVVQGCGEKGVEFRLLGHYQSNPNKWLEANLVWENPKLDLALLKFDSESDVEEVIPKVKKLNLNDQIPYTAYGFPAFRKRVEQNKPPRYDPYPVEGWIKPLPIPKQSGELLLEIKGAAPDDMEKWKGMSGSPILTNDGYLAGVIIQGSSDLLGRQLTGVALDWVIDKDEIFRTQIKQHFQKDLICIDLERIEAEKAFDEAKKAFDIELEIDAWRIKQAISPTDKTYIDNEIEECNRKLKELNRSDKSNAILSTIPKKQLLDVLSEIRKSNSVVFLEAWQKIYTTNCLYLGSLSGFFKSLSVRKIYAILLFSNNSELLPKFLSILHHSLVQNKQPKHLISRLRGLAKATGFEISEYSVYAETAETNKKIIIGKGSLFVKIRSIHGPQDDFATFSIAIWFISDRKIYQARVKKSLGKPEVFGKQDEQLVDELKIPDNYREELVVDSVLIVESSDLKIQAKVIKQKTSELIAELWKESDSRLRKLKPEVVFCVPSRFLEIDFQNIKVSAVKRLGVELAVSVSCLERYEGGKLEEEQQEDWIKRWQVLEDYPQEFCLSHLEPIDPNAFNPTCLEELYYWLQERDIDREGRCLAGIGFYQPYREVTMVIENSLKFGLPIVFWPGDTLDVSTISKLKESLKTVPQKLLASIQKYRIRNRKGTEIGSLSILLDNPYLCPPDCKVDYH
ncbi:MAG: trypsin-like peptidase domain-containing protein [Leptolyngbyaceae cyanobacterium MO_188.B28]|nr:trypsin-like peptidase domain-containing protein [Leptolyngbyaceae cyanobacterium MO_188.B28]